MHMIKNNWWRANKSIIADFDTSNVAACGERHSFELCWWPGLGLVE